MTISNSKLSERMQVFFGDHDPSTNSTLVYTTGLASNVNWINVEKWNRIMLICFRTVGTGSIQNAQIMVASDVNGTGATSLVTSGSTEATGLLNAAQPSNDNTGKVGAGMIVLEATAADIESTLKNGAYVAARISYATASDEMGLCWILSDPRYGTANYTSTKQGASAPGAV